MKHLVLFSALIFCGLTYSQTIRGVLTDKETLEPIIGAKIELLDVEPYTATVSNYEGQFRLDNVPVGKQSIFITFLGYEDVLMRNIEVSSKEVVLQISMVESVNMMKEVEVTGEKKGESINKMASVSNRTFSIEESKRYAGSLNDVSRMAQNFAGVQGGNDSRNDIIVRGNSPSGILYRMEGIDIPNPNHFARFGTTGGPISMLNNNVLANSGFMTGAFPAEYGNATAGVFDLKMRNGNNEKHEFLFQFGFNGAELMAEGPLSKNKKASYLISYRYNDLVLFQKMGVSIGTNALPVYQDLSFKLNFPHKKGVTSIFGLGGLSDISILAEETGENDVYALDNSNTYYSSTVGILGLNHKRRIGNSSYINFSLAYQTGINDIKNDTVDLNYQNPFLTYLNKSYINKLTSVAFYNKKLNSKNVFKTGLQTDVYFLNLNDSVYRRSIGEYVVLRSFKGNLMLFQPYFQYQYRPNPNMTFNVGVHYQILTNNNKGMIEPRAGWNWYPTEKSKISFGYGLHSQMLPMEVYFYETMVNNEKIKPNENLGFSKSHHFILGYQHFFPFGIQAKAELYYQHLFDIPVDVNINSYSMANFGANFVDPFPMYMSNNGLGRNYGLDLTLEKYLDKGFYFLVTGSLYQSFYTPSNDKEYNTAFSGDYTFNALSGYEFKFKPKKNGQQHSLTLDLKFTRNGGRRYTPILLEESIAINNEVRDNENAFSLKYDDYMKGDIRIGYRIIGKKITQEFALDVQNFTNRKNILLEQYNPNIQQIDKTYQTGRLPIGLYRIYF